MTTPDFTLESQPNGPRIGGSHPSGRELRAGWCNLAAAGIGMGLGIPAYGPVSSFFLRALEHEFLWTKAQAAGAMIALPITALALPLFGILIDRFGVRIMAGLSCCTLVGCYLLLAQLHGSLIGYYGLFIGLNVLGCATGPVCFTRLIVSHFVVSRGAALAIAQMGIALLAIALPPLIGWFMGTAGWRGAYIFLAAASLLGGVAAQLLMQPGPRTAVSATSIGSTRAPYMSGSFWILGAAIFAVSTASYGIVTQFESVIIERGGSAATAMWLASLLAGSVLISRLVVGRWLDTRDANRVASAVMILAACGAVLLAIHQGTIANIIAVCFVGLSVGAELDLMGFFCARLLGTARYARNYGMLSIFFYTGIFLGGAGLGKIHDMLGTYRPGLIVAAGFLGVSALLFEILPRFRPDFVVRSEKRT